MGEHRLKGLDTAERLWQVIAPDIPKNFPPLPTLREHPHNLPLQLTSFIGRVNELRAIQQALETHRLVTLTGPGGIGKTRLSIHTAFDRVGTFVMEPGSSRWSMPGILPWFRRQLPMLYTFRSCPAGLSPKP
jgi:hypothetical protein